MKINTITHFIKDAFISLKRNRTISLASIITVLITFFVLGIFVLVAANINKGISTVQDKVELKVFLKDDIKLIDQREIEIKLREFDGVKEVTYQSKEEEYNNIKSTNEGLVQGYTFQTNPFPASFTVKLEAPEYSAAIAEGIKDFEGIDTIGGQQKLVDTIVRIVSGIRAVGIGLFAILVGVSIFLIMNTTKLTVYSRRREVGIMKFVGATDWFIRWPFIMEGMALGFGGALIATLVLRTSYSAITNQIYQSFMFLPLIPQYPFLTNLTILLIVLGMIIGALGSAISLKKFMKV